MPDAARVHDALLARGVLAGLPLGTWYPDDPLLRESLLVCATEVTTDDEIRRFGDALHDILADDAQDAAAQAGSGRYAPQAARS